MTRTKGTDHRLTAEGRDELNEAWDYSSHELTMEEKRCEQRMEQTSLNNRKKWCRHRQSTEKRASPAFLMQYIITTKAKHRMSSRGGISSTTMSQGRSNQDLDVSMVMCSFSVLFTHVPVMQLKSRMTVSVLKLSREEPLCKWRRKQKESRCDKKTYSICSIWSIACAKVAYKRKRACGFKRQAVTVPCWQLPLLVRIRIEQRQDEKTANGSIETMCGRCVKGMKSYQLNMACSAIEHLTRHLYCNE